MASNCLEVARITLLFVKNSVEFEKNQIDLRRKKDKRPNGLDGFNDFFGYKVIFQEVPPGIEGSGWPFKPKIPLPLVD